MNIEIFMEYITYLLIGIGMLAFLTSAIVQVIKELPFVQNVQTNAVAFLVSCVLCCAAVLIACGYFSIVFVWYYMFAAFIAAFLVYLVATGGWERVTEMWDRTKYNHNNLIIEEGEKEEGDING